MREKSVDYENLSYEAAYEQLEGLVRRLESGELTLEESVALYAQGQQLSAHCQKLLEEARLKIQQVDDAGVVE